MCWISWTPRLRPGKTPMRRNNAWIVLTVIAIGLITVGALNGEINVMFTKAIYICKECIGIG